MQAFLQASRKARASRRLLAAGAVFAIVPGSLSAIEAQVRFRPEKVEAGEAVVYELTLTGTDDLPPFEPTFPESFAAVAAEDYYTLRSRSPDSDGSWAQLVWKAFPTTPGRFTIPPTTLQLGTEIVLIPEAQLTVVPPRADLSQLLRLELQMGDDHAYPGQVLAGSLQLTVRSDIPVMLHRPPESTHEGLSVELADDFAHVSRGATGSAEKVFQWAVRLQPFRPGIATEKATLILRWEEPRPGDTQNQIGYGNRRFTERMVQSDLFELPVRPLPRNTPAGHRGAVGEWALSTAVESPSGTADAGFSWEVILAGDGALPIEDVPFNLDPGENWIVSGPQHTATAQEHRYRYHLQPRREGWHDLPTVEFVSFHPGEDSFQTQTAGGEGVVVEPSTDAAPRAPEEIATVGSVSAPRSHPLRDPLLWGVALALLGALLIPRLLRSRSVRPGDA